ncbi:hypothetical protein GCM10011371_13180 [Novosphingobium marinum]|uniref:Uncharacterized protein n=1 Tax=Novosphingobium marinum TaxID=1514948 RepID=A0A7Y9XVL2_9SPHN|nr:hypothetical protein [Novosphingobium marinum]NYH95426.1 hypothetical protein [Novosphingobium marinum]GGC26971.1 hypothetical protein GCM10011371_13180 [Novosphingobium marinum]
MAHSVHDKIKANLASVNGARVRADKQLSDLNIALSMSDLCQTIAVQAAMQAAMMGVAGKLGGLAKAKYAAQTEAAALMEVSAAKAMQLTRVNPIKALIAPIAIRVAVGSTVVVAKKALSSYKTGDDFLDADLALNLAVTAILGIAGQPGAPVKGFVLTGPGVKSLQAFAQTMALGNKIYNFKPTAEDKKLRELLMANKQKLVGEIRRATEEAQAVAVEWATQNQQSIAKQAGKEVDTINFVDRLNLTTKLTSGAKMSEFMRNCVRACIMAETRYALWLAVRNAVLDIETKGKNLSAGVKAVT